MCVCVCVRACARACVCVFVCEIERSVREINHKRKRDMGFKGVERVERVAN